MNLSKTIEILQDATHFHFPADGLDFIDALKLGIEATKEIMQLRDNLRLPTNHILPGETEEV